MQVQPKSDKYANIQEFAALQTRPEMKSDQQPARQAPPSAFGKPGPESAKDVNNVYWIIILM